MSEESMIERVARAIYEANGFKKPWRDPDTQTRWRRSQIAAARAAIGVMRSPDKAMIDAGADVLGIRSLSDEMWHDNSETAGDVLNAMIDAALT
jgi:hypothetical protein